MGTRFLRQQRHSPRQRGRVALKFQREICARRTQRIPTSCSPLPVENQRGTHATYHLTSRGANASKRIIITGNNEIITGISTTVCRMRNNHNTKSRFPKSDPAEGTSKSRAYENETLFLRPSSSRVALKRVVSNAQGLVDRGVVDSGEI